MSKPDLTRYRIDHNTAAVASWLHQSGMVRRDDSLQQIANLYSQVKTGSVDAAGKLDNLLDGLLNDA